MDTNTQKSMSKLKSLQNLKWSTVEYWFIQIFALIVTTKYFIFFILEFIYLKLRKKYEHQEVEISRLSGQIPNDLMIETIYLQDQILFMRHFMSRIGMFARETDILSITLYVSCSAAGLCFFIIGSVFFKQWLNSQLRSCNLILYLIEPELEYQRIETRIGECLKRISESNSNYTNLRFNNLNQDDDNQIKSSDDLSLEFLHKNLIRKTQNLPFKLYSINSDQQKRVIKQDLDNQLVHLKHLTQNKMLFWPPNRNKDWIIELRQFYIKLQTCFNLGTWFQSLITGLYLPYFELKAIEEINSKSANQNNEFSSEHLNLVERLTIVEYFVFVYFAINWYIKPLSLLIVMFKDHSKYLSHISVEFDLLEEQLEKFQQHKSEIKKKQQKQCFPELVHEKYEYKTIRPNTGSDRQLVLSEELEQHLRFNCDKQAIKTYINFNLFQNECKCSLKLTRRIIEQRVCFILCGVFPTLLFVDNLKYEHLATFSIVSLLILSSIDMAFCICALMHSSSMKACNRAWSVLANSTATDPPSTCLFSEDVMPCASKVTIRQRAPMNFRRLFKLNQDQPFRNNNEEDVEEKDEEEVACSLTPHTQILWQRLLENHELLSSNFLVKIFGSIRLDFNGILKINFWIVSVILLSFIYSD